MNGKTYGYIRVSSKDQKTDRLLIIVDFLRDEMELNDAAVAAVLTNIDRESSFRESSVGDFNTAYGMFQWAGIRQNRLIAYCTNHSLEWDSLEGKLKYFQYEIEKDYPDLYRYVLVHCTDSEEGAAKAAFYFCQTYEVPTNMNAELDRRTKLVKEVYYPLMATMPAEEQDPLAGEGELLS